MYGREGKIGLLVPAGNRVILPEFYEISPPGIAFFETRMIVRGDWISEESNLLMIENAKRGLDELRTCGVDVCVFACTASSFLKGRGWDEMFAEDAEKRFRFRVTTAVLSILAAFQRLGKKRVALASPWEADVNQRATQYLEKSGFDVVKAVGDPIDRFKVNDQEPEFAFQLAKQADDPKAEVICIFATDLHSMGVLGKLEQTLGKPVISSNQAILFNTLSMLRYDRRISGYGSLLEKLC
jgi:maleate isomerase